MRSAALVVLASISLYLPLAVARPSAAETAMGVIKNATMGVIATNSARLNGKVFGNPISTVDIDGTPFFHVSNLDATMQDIATDPNCTLTVSQAALDCAASKINPEDPLCFRLSLRGAMVEVSNKSELAKAKAALFNYPQEMAPFPGDYFVTKLDIREIWLIDMFGKAENIPTAQYRSKSGQARGPGAEPWHNPLGRLPGGLDAAHTARWRVHRATWGTLATTSAPLNGPLANTVSFSDGPHDNATGMLFFHVASADTLIQDMTKKFSLTVSYPVVNCAHFDPADPDPRCTRSTFIGTVENVTDPSELDFAKKALSAKHPLINWTDSRFIACKMNLEEIFTIDASGVESRIKKEDYFGASATRLV